MTEPKRRTLGDLTSGWSILLKLMLATYPVIIAWGVWVTSETFSNRAFRNAGDRFTSADGKDLLIEMQANRATDLALLRTTIRAVEARMNALPPADWRERIERLEKSQETIKTNQAAILAKLELLINRQADTKPD